MLQRTPPALLIAAFCLVSAPGIAQTTLSQNSGINSADTWVVMDVTAQTQNITITAPTPMYNPATQTTSSTVAVGNAAAQKFHVEAGYDSNGALVMNLWPAVPATYPNTKVPIEAEQSHFEIGFIRIAAGKVTAFDLAGNPLPLSLPNSSIPTNWPMSILGSSPGRRSLQGL